MPDVNAGEANYLKPVEVKTGDCDVWAAMFIAENQFILSCDNSAELWQATGLGLRRLYEKTNTNWTALLEGPGNNYFSTILNDGLNAEIWKVTIDGALVLVSLYSKHSPHSDSGIPGLELKISGNISSVLFVNNYMLFVLEGGAILFNRLDDSMQIKEQPHRLPDNNVTSIAINKNTKKMAIALENSNHEVMLWNLVFDEDVLLQGFRPLIHSFLSTARKMTFALNGQLIAAVTDSGLEFRKVKDWSKLNHVALSQNCTDMAYSENKDIFIGICQGRKAYLFQLGRNNQYDIESANPVHFVKFDLKPGSNRFAVVLENGDVVLWKLFYEETSNDKAGYYYPMKVAIMHHNSAVETLDFESSGQLLTVSGGKATFWDEGGFFTEKEPTSKPTNKPTDKPTENIQFLSNARKNSLVGITLLFATFATHTDLWD
ncbi:hypothetical protein [Endozoicomonas sp. 4G]|uniref:hypothetical protein n=1 Tax=Endozoicomonas sp. 4G TaxID=2872754 RepID=UPI0020787CCF|nr:hypothetical protein [Endozoicomonas sp. 4G]